MRPFGRLRRAFTLLEVVLALSLAVLILGAIAAALDMGLRTFDSGRTEVEQAQLARAVLHRIAADLRNAVLYTPATATAASGSASAGSSASAGGSAAATQTGALEDAAGEDVEVDDGTIPTQPGLYGELNEVQFDASRVPSAQEIAALAEVTQGGTQAAGASDLKTIAYFVVGQGGTGIGPAPEGSGLMRREMDHATAVYAAEQGQIDLLAGNTDCLAPEVTGLELRYFDGTNWVDTWRSDELGGLPLVVEVAVSIARPRRGTTDYAAATDQPDRTRVYRMLVRLPAAQPVDTETAGAGDESSMAEEPEQ